MFAVSTVKIQMIWEYIHQVFWKSIFWRKLMETGILVGIGPLLLIALWGDTRECS